MSKILYLHGFASSKQSRKVLELRELFPNDFVALDLYSKPVKDIPMIEEHLKELDDPIIVGSSLGGFYAEFFSLKYSYRSLMINPLIDITLIEPYIGEHRYFYSSDSFIFSKEDFTYLLTMKKELSHFSGVNKKIVLLSTNDEIIPISTAVEYYKGKDVEIKLFENLDHNFNNVDIIGKNIENLL